MNKQYTCAQGHRWEVGGEGGKGLALDAISCPECGAAAETLLPEDSEANTLPPSTSEKIAVACPGCGKRMKAKASAAGKQVPCPDCGKPILIPVPPTAAATEGKTLPPKNRDAKEPPGSSRRSGGQRPANATDPADGFSNPPQQADRNVRPPDRRLYDFLAPPEQKGDLGVLGPYRVLKVLGSGGMGVVFRALDPQLQRPVALKAMQPELATSGSAKQRFLREARAAAAIKHDHIVAIYQVGEDRGSPFLAMEFLEGEPLSDRLKREKVVPIADVLRIGREIAAGLAAAHDKGLIHRDIKPANIWLETRGGVVSGGVVSGEKAADHSPLTTHHSPTRVKILDFGLARGGEEETQLTQTGAVVGTPAYMAPEQAQGQDTDHRADLFSLGCVLYEMCTGDRPFKGRDAMAILMALASADPTTPRERNAEVPKGLSDLIMKLLSRKPKERPASAAAVAKTLRGFEKDGAAATDVAPREQQSGAGQRTGAVTADRPARPGLPRWAWLAGIGVLAALIVGGIIIFFARTPSAMVLVQVLDVDLDDKELTFFLDGQQVPAEKLKAPVELTVGQHELVIRRDDTEVRRFTFSVSRDTGPQITLREEEPRPGGKKDSPRRDDFKNKLGMEFVLVPKGKAWLGGRGGALGIFEVDAVHDFYLGKYEVTQEQWLRVLGEYPFFFPFLAGDRKDDPKLFPIEVVTWEDAQRFVKRLNELAKEPGWEYRLPKEIEWEYACRGGPMTDKSESVFDYYFDKPTNEMQPGQANFRGSGKNRTCPVGSYKPNRLGLHDMHGNVWEWCDDVVPHPFDPKGALHRVCRGGGWSDPAELCRLAYRNINPPSHGPLAFGLRIARVPVGKTVIKAVDFAPSLPPDKFVFLSDLKEFDWVGNEDFGKNGGASGKGVLPIAISGIRSAKGLWTHPNITSKASVKYQLDGIKAQLFKTTVAINETTNAVSPLTFQVKGDGKVLWTSKPLTRPGQAQECVVDVEGVRTLELSVTVAGPYQGAHAVWLDPYVTLAKATPAHPKTNPEHAKPNAFDKLRREDVPKHELVAAGGGDIAKTSPELVRVVGSSRLRHWRPITQVAYAPDGKRIISCGGTIIKLYTGEPSVSIWDAETGEELQRLFLNKGVKSFAPGPEGGLLIASDDAADVELWDMNTSKKKAALPCKGAEVVYGSDGLWMACAGVKLHVGKVADMLAGKLPKELKGYDKRALCLALSKDGTFVAMGSDDGTVRVWDVHTGKLTQKLDAHKRRVLALAFSKDGALLATGGDEASIHLWDMATGDPKLKRTLTGNSGTTGLAFSADKNLLATGHRGPDLAWPGLSGWAKSWNLDTFQERFALEGPSVGAVLALCADGKQFACGNGHSLTVWDTASGKPVLQPGGHEGFTAVMAVCPNGTKVATGGRDDGTVRLWAIESGKEIKTFTGLRGEVLSLAISPDGALVAAGGTLDGKNAHVLVWDAVTGEERRRLPGYSGSVAFSPEGKYLAASGSGGIVKVWDVATWSEQTATRLSMKQSPHVAFSGDGKRLAAGSKIIEVGAWQEQGELQGSLKGGWHGSGGNHGSMALSADFKLVAKGTHSSAGAELWDAVSGKLRRVQKNYAFGATAISPDGKLLAMGNKLFDLHAPDDSPPQRQLTVSFVGPPRAVTQSTFTPESRHLITLNSNGTIYIFRLATPPKE